MKKIKNNKVILITGKPGVGKTAVGNLVCKCLNKSILLSIDNIRQLVIGGYIDPATHSWDEFKEQFYLSADAVVAVANIFIRKGFIPVIEGVVLEENFDFWKKNLVDSDLYIFLLTVNEQELLIRNSNKDKSIPNTIPVQNMLKNIDQMLTNLENKNFKVINNLNFNETADEIIKNVYGDTVLIKNG